MCRVAKKNFHQKAILIENDPQQKYWTINFDQIETKDPRHRKNWVVGEVP